MKRKAGKTTRTNATAVPRDAAWFRGKRVTVMGLGVNGGGVGVARWLMLHGAEVTVTDLKDQHALAPSIAELERTFIRASHRGDKRLFHRLRYVLGRHDERDFREADLVIKGPGVPDGNAFIAAARKAGVPVETDVSLFFLLSRVPIIGITGTRGKTTTTALAAAMCRLADRRTVSAGNNRVSVMDAVDVLTADAERVARAASRKGSARAVAPRPVVLELSSFMLEGLAPHRLSPRLAVITNIMRDHLNRYRGMAHYAATKAGIVRYQGVADTAVLNADDARVSALARGASARVLWFSARRLAKGREGAYLDGSRLVLRVGGRETLIVPRSGIRLLGDHNVPNVLAATLAAHAVGVPMRHIRAAIRAFTGVPGRLERIVVKRGVAYVNDTTATSPEGAIAALRAVAPATAGRVILIAGGADKKLVFGEWAREVRKRVHHAVLFDGDATTKMERALRRAGGMEGRLTGARSMEEAVRIAAGLAQSGDTVLLSPGCASFGLFVNEFDRGDRFIRAVRRLR